MPRIEILGGEIEYELLGPEDGQGIVITPGGRFSKDYPGVGELGQGLADGGMRVLLWDRPNCGKSDVAFWGRSESHMRADVLAELLKQLDMAPCVIAGGSGGARDSIVTVIEHPEVATQLVTWSIVGGVYSTMSLAGVYVTPQINALGSIGFEAIVDLPEWKTLIEANPRNRERILSLGEQGFLDLMMQWLDAYVPKPGQTIPGVSDLDFKGIDVPTLIIRGGEKDLNHPKRTSYEVWNLIAGSEIVDPPWPEDAWEQAVKATTAGTGSLFDPWPQAVPMILDFCERTRPTGS